MANLIPWDLYRSCLAVLRHGSLSGAARALGATQPTIGRHIATLEERLGVPLFSRSPGGLIPTEAATALVPTLETMDSASTALERAAANAGAVGVGTVRITASEVMGARVLPPMLAALRERHPGMTIELSLANRVENLLRGDADLAVRMARPAQEALVARRIGAVAVGLFAHRSYLARHGVPASVAELGLHAMIGFDRDDEALRDRDLPAFVRDRRSFAFRCDSQVAQLSAIEAGIGIGGAQLPLARANSDLIAVLPVLTFPLEVWLVMHEDLRTSGPTRTAFYHLAEALARYVGG